MIKPINAKLIDYPSPGGGSSTKSFKLVQNKYFEVHHGMFGGISCTTVSLQLRYHHVENLCFEGHVAFTMHKQIWAALAKDLPVMLKVIKHFSEDNYSKGVIDGKITAQDAMRNALGIR